KQQCAGALQLPLNNCGVMALDYDGKDGLATAIGHAPLSGLIDPKAGAQNSIAEALTNMIWAPLKGGLSAISLSANWMWPCRNEGEDARLYEAVQAVSDFAIELGINVPTGKDSLSMKQKYAEQEVIAPGTVIISAVAHCEDITRIVEPVFQKEGGPVYYLNFSGDDFHLGGSSFAQTQNRIGATAPRIRDAAALKAAFNTIQELIKADQILAGHDVAAGGLLTTLLELCFAEPNTGAEIDLTVLPETDWIKILFAENCGIVIQAVDEQVESKLSDLALPWYKIGAVTKGAELKVYTEQILSFDIPALRDVWYETSFLLDQHQSGVEKATERFNNYKHQPLHYQFPTAFEGIRPDASDVKRRPKAAILREKGSNSEREMAHALYLAGFDVKDVHMTDLISGRETLEDVQFLGAVGGFSNSDVLGSAKGWAGAFKYNEKARTALARFFQRTDVLSVGICNGCQLFLELDLINPDHEPPARMGYNDTHKHESAFTSVVIQENNSVMLSALVGTRLGVWISNGEGKFQLPLSEDQYQIVAKYGYDAYPANPNGSDYNTAMLCSPDGRHLVTMPHIERSIFRWNWAHYPGDRQSDDTSPWILAFLQARKWLEQRHA
ncbi:MAG: phosphoribosylformylglycinamidine synthase subunit PurQ, partial [Bacteroidota bacterium]